MIDQEVLRIIVAKGAGDSTLKKVNRYLNSNPVSSLREICNDIELMCSAGVKRDVAQNIYNSKEKAQLLEVVRQYFFIKETMSYCRINALVLLVQGMCLIQE